MHEQRSTESVPVQIVGEQEEGPQWCRVVEVTYACFDCDRQMAVAKLHDDPGPRWCPWCRSERIGREGGP